MKSGKTKPKTNKFILLPKKTSISNKKKHGFYKAVIFDKIKNIGWIKFYSWYSLTGVINLLIFLIGVLIGFILILVHTFPFEKLIAPLILTPYIYIFFARSIALIYQSDNTI